MSGFDTSTGALSQDVGYNLFFSLFVLLRWEEGIVGTTSLRESVSYLDETTRNSALERKLNTRMQAGQKHDSKLAISPHLLH